MARSAGACDLSVVVMAYDEAANVAWVVQDLAHTLLGAPFSWEIVIIDDGSQDGTGRLVDDLGRRIPGVRAVHHSSNLGLGEVYRTGFRESRAEWVSFLPADGQYSARVICEFMARTGDVDLVLGYLSKARPGKLAHLFSRLERLLLKALIGPLPPFQGLFLVRRSLVESLPLSSRGRGWMLLIELMARAQRRGARFASLQLAAQPRLSGKSKVMNVRTITSNLLQLLALHRELARDGR